MYSVESGNVEVTETARVCDRNGGELESEISSKSLLEVYALLCLSTMLLPLVLLCAVLMLLANGLPIGEAFAAAVGPEPREWFVCDGEFRPFAMGLLLPDLIPESFMDKSATVKLGELSLTGVLELGDRTRNESVELIGRGNRAGIRTYSPSWIMARL